MDIKINYEKNDEYYTPKIYWDWIKEYIPTNKIIWESFYGDGKSGNILKELGFSVYSENEDFFEKIKNPPENSICVSNPPFTIKREIVKALLENNIPFILLLPFQVLQYKWLGDLFKKDNDLSVIFAKKRHGFIKNGTEQMKPGAYKMIYLCWRIELPTQMIFL